MGEAYSVFHAACLAAQLPHGARCRVAEDEHEKWSSTDWMLWRIEMNTRATRYALGARADKEELEPIPYPGKETDELVQQIRITENRAKVDKAFGMS